MVENSASARPKPNTNIKHSSLINSLPLVKEEVYQKLFVKQSENSEADNNNQNRNDNQNNINNLENIENQGQNNDTSIMSILFRIGVVFYLFHDYFEGFLYWIFLAVLGLYAL